MATSSFPRNSSRISSPMVGAPVVTDRGLKARLEKGATLEASLICGTRTPDPQGMLLVFVDTVDSWLRNPAPPSLDA